MTAKWLRWLLVPILSLGAGAVMAMCTVGAQPVVVGPVSSLSLIGTNQGNMGTGGISCTSTLSLLNNNYMRVIRPATPTVLSNGQGNTIPFRILTQQTGGTEILPGSTVDLSNSTLLSLLGSTGGLPLYFHIPAGANVPAGTYTATVNLNWQYAICDLGVAGICSWVRSPGLTQNCVLGCGPPVSWGTGSVAALTITLTVSKACIINSTPSVNLGDRALVSQFTTVTTSFGVTCTNTEGYTIGFTTGGNYQAPWRRLASGANRMNYNLYFPGTSTIWTTTQTQSAAGTGLQQTFQFDTAVDPSQANVPAGEYIDNVTLIINY